MSPGTASASLVRLALASSSIVGAAIAASSIAACSEPARQVELETAATRVRRVATVWWENTVDSGAREGDPAGIASFHLEREIRVELSKDGSAREHRKQKETFRMTDGRAYSCTATAEAAGRATYTGTPAEPRVTVHTEPTTIRRECDRPGFPIPSKDLPASTTVYVLRGDRLVAVEPRLSRRVLLPGQ